MQACEELMLHGQVQFLICHQHALAPSRITPDQFRSVIIGSDALIPVVAPDTEGEPRHSLEASRPDIPYLSYSSESGLGRIVEAHRFAERAPGLTSVFSAHLAASLLGMARDGWGVGWLPQSLCATDIAEGRLVRAGGSDWEIPVAVRLFRPAARQSLAAERFWGLISQI
jgi:LysR family transcriptional regulator, hypochlorite-specific transcription factor HypT